MMGQARIQPSRMRRAFNGWCRGLFAGQHFEHVLNLGCGHDIDRQGSTYSQYFDAKEVTRVDPETHTTYPAYEQCLCGGERFRNPVDIVGRAESLPFPNETFDMVFCNWVLYHAEHDKALDEICRVLQPQGKLFASWNASGLLGPIYEAIIVRFTLIAYCSLHMARDLDGRDWFAEAVWGTKQ